jgi:hypothetical protein
MKGKHPAKTQGRSSSDGLRKGGRLFPVPGQEIGDAAGRVGWKAPEDVGEPGAGIEEESIIWISPS